MYGIFTNIYPKNHPNVGKYTSTMDPMGIKSTSTHDILMVILVDQLAGGHPRNLSTMGMIWWGDSEDFLPAICERGGNWTNADLDRPKDRKNRQIMAFGVCHLCFNNSSAENIMGWHVAATTWDFLGKPLANKSENHEPQGKEKRLSGCNGALQKSDICNVNPWGNPCPIFQNDSTDQSEVGSTVSCQLAQNPGNWFARESAGKLGHRFL